jgi:hypothetical protein
MFTGGIIVASSPDAGFYKSDESPVSGKTFGWQQIELSFYIPWNYTDKSLNIYLWNNGLHNVFFDDLSIEIFE